MPEPLNKEELEEKLNNGESLEGIEIGDVNFSNHNFEEEPNFSGALFTGQANFEEAKFLNGANFIFAQFSGKGKANFSRAQFSGEGGADFLCAQFSSEGGADFLYAKFSGERGADFSGAIFSGKGGASFSGAQFLGPGKIKFAQTIFEESAPVFFNRVEMDFPENMQFVDVHTLGSALFLYTDLEKISFKNVRFRQTPNWFFGREYLADEVRNDIVINDLHRVEYDRDYYKQVEILYRQLKLNFENQRDYARAGDFHYSEMEMKRKGQMLEWEERPVPKYLRFLKYLTLTQCYKIVSGYGEKWLQALASFIVVWILFTGLNLPLIEPVKQQTTQVKKCEQDSLHRATGSAMFSFKVLTLQRWDRDFRLKGSSYLPGLFIALQHLIGPTIIALMLLAIRRQFRR